jgi:23S rRNA (cytidine2498-2'-O)-methyltransferase
LRPAGAEVEPSSCRAIITCSEDATSLVELELLGTSARLPGEWLDTGDTVQGSLLLVDLSGSFASFSDEVRNSVFIWHLAPADLTIDLTGSDADVALLVDCVPQLANFLVAEMPFSVQARVLGSGKLPYRKVVLNEAISTAIEDRTRNEMDCRHPGQIVSLLCTPDTAYIGVSTPQENRSEWAGGQHRLKASEAQVSRSEFKLEEALQVFGLQLPTSGNALDIGASPGGWSRLLAEAGLKVVAVDPAELDASLEGAPRINHVRKRIQEYRGGPPEFDVIVNDMKMDPRDSIRAMVPFSRRISSKGFGLITLKLPKVSPGAGDAKRLLDMLRVDLELLSQEFEVIGVRQLYHNRSEVTVAFRRRRPFTDPSG